MIFGRGEEVEEGRVIHQVRPPSSLSRSAGPNEPVQLCHSSWNKFFRLSFYLLFFWVCLGTVQQVQPSLAPRGILSNSLIIYIYEFIMTASPLEETFFSPFSSLWKDSTQIIIVTSLLLQMYIPSQSGQFSYIQQHMITLTKK